MAGQTTVTVLAATGLITALALLSLLSPSYSLAGYTADQVATDDIDIDPDDIPLPENSSINASNYINTDRYQNMSLTKNEDVITTVGEALYDIFGEDIQDMVNRSGDLTETRNASRTSLTNNTSIDETGFNGSASGELNQSNVTVVNRSTDDSPIQQSNNTTTANLSDSPRNSSEELPPERPTSSENSSTDSNKTAETRETVDNSSVSSSDTKQTTGETGEKNESATNDNKQPTYSDYLPTGSSYLVWPVVMLLSGISGLLLYRSNWSLGQLFTAIVTTIPDMVYRGIVWIVNTVVAGVRTIGMMFYSLFTAPKQTITSAISAITTTVQQVYSACIALLNRFWYSSTRAQTDLDHVWHELKQKAGVSQRTAITPEEIREKAIDRGIPKPTVDDLVAAFRQKQYTKAGYTGTVPLHEWEETLQGDSE